MSDAGDGARSEAPKLGHVKQTSFDVVNTLVLVFVGVVGIGLLVRAGDLTLVRWPFLLYIVGVTLGALWFGAFELSRRRLLLLVLVGASAGILTQVVGADVEGVWTYAGPRRDYSFVTTMFAYAATFAYGLTALVFGPWVRRHLRHRPRWMNPLVVVVLFAVLVVGSTPYRLRFDVAFWAYYGALGLFGLWASLLMDLGTLLTLVGVAVVVGIASETLGASSGVWSFRGAHPSLPPAYLVFGSWPLEILLHYGLSGVLARERLVARPRYFREELLFRPQREHPMWTGGKKQRVVCVRDADKLRALDAVLERAGLLDVLARRLKETGKTPEELEIVIKPNLMFMYSEEDRSTFTDPELVEHLVERIWAAGYRRIAVVEAQSAYGNFFLDREVANVARVVGYVPNDHYRIVDLTLEKVPHRFSGPLGMHVVGPTWRDADVRISFAKNKTHTWAWYTLTLKNIYGALAMQDKIHEYHYKRELYYPTIDMLVSFPVHFGLIDATLSADGPFGIFADKEPNQTDTILGGESLLAVDWVGAEKMGLDPMVSRYMQLAVQAFGKPEIEIDGDASKYEPWCNVPKEIVDFWDTAEESYGFTNTVFSVLNHDFMSPAFRRKPMTRLVGALARVLGPLGGVIYKEHSPVGPEGVLTRRSGHGRREPAAGADRGGGGES
jgi:uncharacterized protein (DUF362 family)